MEPRVEYARAPDGTTVAFAATGSGPPLLLPSLPFSDFLDEWAVPPLQAAYERLAAHFRLIQHDGRGTGHSQRDIGGLTFEAMLADLGAVLSQTRASGAGVVGLYDSCPIALASAAADPGRVSRLALFGGTARGWAAMRSTEHRRCSASSSRTGCSSPRPPHTAGWAGLEASRRGWWRVPFVKA